MAYETGSATDVHDMLNKIRLFLLSNGYTVNNWSVVTGPNYRLNVQRGDMYLNLCSAQNYNPSSTSTTRNIHGIALSPSTGYNPSAGGSRPWKNQPGAPDGESTTYFSEGIYCVYAAFLENDIPEYHLFADGDNFAAAISYMTNHFQWLTWGRLDVFGGSTGQLNGFFVSASANGGYAPSSEVVARIFTTGPKGALRFFDGSTANWFIISGGSTSAAGAINPIPYQNTTSTGNSVPLNGLLQAMPSDIGGFSPLLPCYILLRQIANQQAFAFGHFDLVRITTMDTYPIGHEMVLDGYTWKILPVCMPTDNYGIGSTAAHALAVKKIT